MEFSVGSAAAGPVRQLPVRRRARHRERPTPRGRLLSDVFDIFPVGMMVVSAAGRILTWNPALEELLGESLEPGATCCTALGCRTPGTPLEGICLTEAAITSGQRLDDVTLELPGTLGSTATVGATPFHGGRERAVLFQVRADARPVDGLRAPALTTEPRISIRTLGLTVVETATGEPAGDWLDQRAGRLLKYLVAHRGAPVHADAIAEALWPRARVETTNTVRHFIHVLRTKLEPERGRYRRSSFILARNGGYQIDRERVRVDADDFERQAKAGLTALAAGDSGSAIKCMEAAMSLYHGDFLADEPYAVWAIPERERLRDLACKPLHALAALTENVDAAAGYLERLAEMEPLDIDVQRELLSVWLWQGRRSRALRHYRALQSRLMREFGERMPFDLADLPRGRSRVAGGARSPRDYPADLLRGL